MGCTFYFVSHPNVQVPPDVPVPEWPLSELGHSRMQACLRLPWVASINAIFGSPERKARDSAAHLTNHLSLPFVEMPDLQENDRSSTGYLPLQEFELVADAFFAEQFYQGLAHAFVLVRIFNHAFFRVFFALRV